MKKNIQPKIKVRMVMKMDSNSNPSELISYHDTYYMAAQVSFDRDDVDSLSIIDLPNVNSGAKEYEATRNTELMTKLQNVFSMQEIAELKYFLKKSN